MEWVWQSQKGRPGNNSRAGLACLSRSNLPGDRVDDLVLMSRPSLQVPNLLNPLPILPVPRICPLFGGMALQLSYLRSPQIPEKIVPVRLPGCLATAPIAETDVPSPNQVTPFQ